MSSVGDKQLNIQTLRSGSLKVLLQYAPFLSILTIFLLVFLGFGLTTDRFLSSINLFNVLRQVAPSIVVGVTTTLVIAAAGIDLSIGSMVAFAGVAAAIILRAGLGPEATIFVVLGLGLLSGLIAGYLIAYQGLPSFIVTLGSLSILLGLAKLASKGFSTPINTANWFHLMGQGDIGDFPSPVLIAGSVVFLGWIILNRTKLGLYMRGIGSNVEAVRRSGVPVKRVTTIIYGISGLGAALAGIMNAARLQSGNTSSGLGLELRIIAAVVLGGTSLFGGRGSILGTVLGVFTIAFINNGLILNHVSPFLVTIVGGLILLLSVWLNTRVFSRWI